METVSHFTGIRGDVLPNTFERTYVGGRLSTAFPSKFSCLHDANRIKGSDETKQVQKKKNDQGRHECEVLGSGSEWSESSYAWDTCDKNPGHKCFIPATQFSLEHLPENCRDSLALEYVQTMAALTVRLRVRYTSRRRPRGYSFHAHRGSDILHTGTGWLFAITSSDLPCQCLDFKAGQMPRQRCYKLYIDTACHVVYNSAEAKHTKVDFFYDEEDSTSHSSSMKTVLGLKVVSRDVGGDWSRLVCVTHDLELVGQLQAKLAQRGSHKELFLTTQVLKGWNNLCVIVSHPHGQPKQVSVGEIKKWAILDTQTKKFIYTTPTCPGSSGAPILVLDDCGMVNDIIQIINQKWTAPHSEGNFLEVGLNCSGSSQLDSKARYNLPPQRLLFDYLKSTPKSWYTLDYSLVERLWPYLRPIDWSKNDL